MTKIDERRRREGKTDYSRRMNLLKGESPRIVFRSREAQDSIDFGVTSKALLDYGWPKSAAGSLKSVTASYLLGILMAKKMTDKKKLPVIDFGMIRNVHKSRAYAFMKGLIDAGINVKHKEGIFPEDNRIKGEHLKNKVPFEQIKSKIMK